MRINRKERKLKEMISAAYAPPEPKHKSEFIKKYSYREIGSFSFILSQIRFIRKWVWAVSLVLFAGLVAFCGFLAEKDATVWIISALVPFIAVTAFAESTKSLTYEMDELEKAARFSVESVLLARMEIIGVFHLTLFCTLSIIVRGYTGMSFIRNGIYLLVPYLLTNLICMLCIRGNPRGAELIQIYTKTAVFISAAILIVERYTDFLYQEKYFIWWLTAFFLLLTAVIREYGKVICKRGGRIWNC